MPYSTLTVLLIVALPTLGFAAETSPLASGEIFDAGYLVKLGAGLALVIALFIGMAWFMRNMGIGTVSKDGMERLKVAATLSVGNRERIVLLDVGGDQVLIGVTQERIETLHTIPATKRQNDADFQSALRQSLDKSDTEAQTI